MDLRVMEAGALEQGSAVGRWGTGAGGSAVREKEELG